MGHKSRMLSIRLALFLTLLSVGSTVNIPQEVSWYPALGPTDPCNITAGRAVVPGPLDDSICQGVTPGLKKCACVSAVESTPSKPSFTRLCGSCFDPCALHFHVDYTD